jgi:hypothetical protein
MSLGIGSSLRERKCMMSSWTKEQLENMLEDVVNELDLSAEMIEKHGQLGTAPSELVRLVLMEKDLRIRMLSIGMKGSV